MIEEISYVRNPDLRKIPEEGMHDFGSVEGIAKYIDQNNDWVIKEILLWNESCLKNNTPLTICKFNIDAHYAEGDISGNIATLAKAWYSKICKGYGHEA